MVHLLASWVSFLQVVQAKKGICTDVQMAGGDRAAVATAWQTKGFLLWCHLFHHQCLRRVAYVIWKIFKIFYGVILGSRMAVLEPRYPVLSVVYSYSLYTSISTRLRQPTYDGQCLLHRDSRGWLWFALPTVYSSSTHSCWCKLQQSPEPLLSALLWGYI